MTNKELKRYDYILAKKDANILLSLSEQQFLILYKKEYEDSGHRETLLNDVDAALIRKMYGLPDNTDMNAFLKERRRIVLRKKFAHLLMDEENSRLKNVDKNE
jgi:hypothetical protein